MSLASSPTPSHVAATTLALASVARASAVASRLAGSSARTPDLRATQLAYTSERWLRVDGAPPVAFAPLSGFFATRDGWVRTHANYAHHAAALTRALRLPAGASATDAARAFSTLSATEAVRAVTDLGGLCVSVERSMPEVDEHLRSLALVEVTRVAPASPIPLRSITPVAPLAGIRVLDLTRVIAGPVAGRTLALLGAEVLRIDGPHLPEIAWQHLDTGHGKRSALLDVRRASGFDTLMRLAATADIVLLGYRPGAFDRLGLTPTTLASVRPGIIVARLAAWQESPDRGFDSLVQAASGIAWLESPDGVRPGALPAQALDHSAGYLLASAVMELLERRAVEGGSWLAQTSLRRIAAELLGMPLATERGFDPPAPPDDHLQHFDVGGVRVRTVGPAVSYPGGPSAFRAPRPWGRDEPRWITPSPSHAYDAPTEP